MPEPPTPAPQRDNTRQTSRTPEQPRPFWLSPWPFLEPRYLNGSRDDDPA